MNLEKLDSLPMVHEWEVACGSTPPAAPTQPSVEKLKLRLSLELEELYEKAQAMGLEGTFCSMLQEKSVCNATWENPVHPVARIYPSNGEYDLVSLLDACCDQRYVQDGTVLTCGLQHLFPYAFDEVHRSNMSKFCKTEPEISATRAKYMADGIETFTRFIGTPPDRACAICRAADGKILKSINYSPANLAQFFYESPQASSPAACVPEPEEALPRRGGDYSAGLD